MFVKHQKAIDYANSFSVQCPQLDPPMSGDLCVTAVLYYASKRPDLDDTIVMDAMQSVVHIDKKTKDRTVLRNNIYHNDRQVKEKHIYHRIDKNNPRAEITVEIIEEKN